MAYEVYRGGLLLETTCELTATDVVEEGGYDYCVYAVYEDCQSGYVCKEVEVHNATSENQFVVINIFPNPSSGQVTIQCAEMTLIEAFSVEGRLLQRINVRDNMYQLDGLERGVYIVRIHKGEETFIRRVVKW